MSDHLSSYRALQDPVVDLTDLYAFPTPGAAGRLTLIMNTFPDARPGDAFSDAVAYRFRIRTATVHPGDSPLTTWAPTEHTIAVTFSDLDGGGESGDPARQTATVVSSGGSVTTALVGEPNGTEGDDLRVFAGLRLDPFFMDVPAEAKTRRTRTLAFTSPGTNILEGLNALSIIVEFDVRAVLRADVGPLVAVMAETTTIAGPLARFERKGRPEMKNFMLSLNGNDPDDRLVDLRDPYNLEDAFALSTCSPASTHGRTPG